MMRFVQRCRFSESSAGYEGCPTDWSFFNDWFE